MFTVYFGNIIPAINFIFSRKKCATNTIAWETVKPEMVVTRPTIWSDQSGICAEFNQQERERVGRIEMLNSANVYRRHIFKHSAISQSHPLRICRTFTQALNNFENDVREADNFIALKYRIWGNNQYIPEIREKTKSSIT